MYNDNTAPRARLLSLLVAAACAGVCVTASADPTITLTAVYALNGATTPTDAVAETSFTGSDFYFNKNEGASSVFFHTYGLMGATTYFGARASGDGADFYAKTSALYSGTYTNNTGAALSLDFSFYVDSGETSLYGTGVGSANTQLQIRRNGAVVSQGSTTITQTVSGTTCSENDIGDLGDWASCSTAGNDNSVYGNGRNFTINLGLVAAGEQITIDYDIIATVSGHGTQLTCGGGYGGYAGYGGYGGYGDGYGGYGGYGGVEQPTYACYDYRGIARSGDPFGVNVVDEFSLNATAADLPEPGSLALLGAAGGGWWLSRRRRNRSAD